MKVTDLYRIVKALNLKEREDWISLFQRSLKLNSDKLNTDSLERFVIALYAYADKSSFSMKSPSIAYGAGNIAKEYLPKILRYTNISEIWDAYTETKSLFDIAILRPHFDKVVDNINIIVFIEACATRCEVMSLLISKGYKNVYSYKDFILIAEAVSFFPCIKESATKETEQLLNDFLNQYHVINSKYAHVNYSVVPKKLQSQQIDFNFEILNLSDFSRSLFELLTFSDSDKERIENSLSVFINSSLCNAYNFACQMEIFLRNILANGVKTKERPIRMLDDTPYDQFAVYDVIRETVRILASDNQKALNIIGVLRELSPDSVPLMSVECYFLMHSHQLDKALRLSRCCMKKEPNGLLANETFYCVALLCKRNDIHVTEPLPEYDLNDRFCWSGISFALCYGFDTKGSMAEFMPCFRTLQCAARPKGDFWMGDEWIEFRKSLVDGSFKYCQKNQCSNIVAGWLPKKTECTIDLQERPQLDELHFSYDFHCNLKCPSCRLEIKTNSAEQNAHLDMLFEKNLRPLLKKAKHLCLSGCGEAAISQHSKRVLQSLSKEEYSELAVELRTNVFSLNSATWTRLGTGVDVIKHVAASIDAASKELFEKLRFPAKWDIVLKNLEFLQALRNSDKIEMFEFHVVVQTENIDELVDIIKMAIKYDADAITFSRLVNWRGMSIEEYNALNPFWQDHPRHTRLMSVIASIIKLREEIESAQCELTVGKKKLFINMHCVPDPNSTYDEIRVGKLKIR